jgi:hypothetical protein
MTGASPSHQKIIVIGLHVIVLVSLALHLYVRTLPPTPQAIPQAQDAESAWWGMWPVTAAPEWAAWVGAVSVVGCIVWFWAAKRGKRWAEEVVAVDDLGAEQPNGGMRPWLIVVSVLFVLSFFLFPIVHTRWGDAFMLAKGLAWPDPTLRITHSWQAPLDVFVHSQVWLLLGEHLGWQDATPVYRLLSPLAGALYLAVLLALSQMRWLAPDWLTYGLLASLGLIQLFYGYVENYSFAAVGVIAYLWLGLRVLERRNALWTAALALAITNAAHPSTVVLTPSLLYLGWRSWRERNIAAWSAVLQIVLPVVMVGGMTFLWMEWSGHGLNALLETDRPGGGDGRWFVPLWETTTRWEHYTMFSWLHLRDFVNQHLLSAPVVLPSLLWIAGNRLWLRRSTPDGFTHVEAQHHIVFLAIGTLCYLLFIWVWNPDYGGQRDWDLFSLALLPTTLLLIALLPVVLRCGWALTAGAAPLIVFQALHTAAWVYFNTLPWEWPG